jgi:hypothetical protein
MAGVSRFAAFGAILLATPALSHSPCTQSACTAVSINIRSSEPLRGLTLRSANLPPITHSHAHGRQAVFAVNWNPTAQGVRRWRVEAEFGNSGFAALALAFGRTDRFVNGYLSFVRVGSCERISDIVPLTEPQAADQIAAAEARLRLAPGGRCTRNTLENITHSWLTASERMFKVNPHVRLNDVILDNFVKALRELKPPPSPQLIRRVVHAKRLR